MMYKLVYMKKQKNKKTKTKDKMVHHLIFYDSLYFRIIYNSQRLFASIGFP